MAGRMRKDIVEKRCDAYDDPMLGQTAGRSRRRLRDPFNLSDSMNASISMASVKDKVLSFAKARFPEKKFVFINFDDCFIAWEKGLRAFLAENAIPHKFLDAFGHEHYEWRRSHDIKHNRDGSIKLIEPRIDHIYSVFIEWEGKALFLFQLNRYETHMSMVSQIVGAVEDMDALKSLDRAMLMYSREKSDADKEEHEIMAWDEIILPGNMLNEIRADIETFFTSAHLYHELGLPYKRGMIFTGPPGNGKTLLCRIIAAQFHDKPFITIESSRDLDNRWVKNAYRELEFTDGGIICLEDLDSLFSNSNLTLSGFLNILDGIKSNYGVLTIATSNKPEHIDPALVRRPSRFDRKWVFGEPDDNCRSRLLRLHFRDKIDPAILEEYVDMTDGWSAAYIKELYITAAFISMRETPSVITPEHVRRAYETLDSQRVLEKRNFNPAAKPVGFAG